MTKKMQNVLENLPKKLKREYEKKPLEKMNLLDDFLFNAMVSYPEQGEEFVRKILKILFERDFTDLKVISQKSYGGRNNKLHGARLDVYVEEDGSVETDAKDGSTIYDLEPDRNNKAEAIASFPKRSRFYHAMIDSRVLKSGENFGKLKDVYVIFICDYDPFGYDQVKYTIKNTCLELPEMPYEDGAQTIVLYTKGKHGDISKELRQLLNYMENTTDTNAVNDTLKEIQEMVETVKRDGEVSLNYMKGFERDMLMYEEGMEDGRQAERENTERERKRADMAEQAYADVEYEKRVAMKRIAELEKELAKVKL